MNRRRTDKLPLQEYPAVGVVIAVAVIGIVSICAVAITIVDMLK